MRLDSAPSTIRQTHSFPDNRLAQQLFGEYEQHLLLIERELGVRIGSRGNTVDLEGGEGSVARAIEVLDALYADLSNGLSVDKSAVRSAVRSAPVNDAKAETTGQNLTIRTRQRTIAPRNATQAAYLRAIQENKLTFGIGPAGTGKTYLAVAAAVAAMAAGDVERLVLSRPAVEAGERIGFLPGDMKEKVDPYLRPLYDALHDMLPADLVARHIEAGSIEIAPLAFMRGRTLAHSFVILDEAQNTSPQQMMMFLTRFGEGSTMVIAGDPDQTDLPVGHLSGLADAKRRLAGVPEIEIVTFTGKDVVRDPLVARIVQAYAPPPMDRNRETDVLEFQDTVGEREVSIDIECDRWNEELEEAELIVEEAVYETLQYFRPTENHGTVGVLLSDDARLKEMNTQFRQIEKPTNVLAFPFDEDSPGDQPSYLGDIAVSFETVAAEAAEQQKTLADHLRHMIVHGVLHLLGYDHISPDDQQKMENIERSILATLGTPDPYEAI